MTGRCDGSLMPSPCTPPVRGWGLVNVEFLGLILYSSIHTFLSGTLLGDTVTKVHASPRNSTWFTRPFLLVRERGLTGDETSVMSGDIFKLLTPPVSSQPDVSCCRCGLYRLKLFHSLLTHTSSLYDVRG